MITGTLSGRLTADPQVHQGNNGPFTSFSVAVNHGKKNDVEQVTFVDCTSNGKTGELIAQRFKKGNVFSGPAIFSIREYESNGQKNKALSASISMIDWQASQPTPQDQSAATAPPVQGYAQPPAGYQQPGYGAPPMQQQQYAAAPPVQPGYPPQQQFAAPPQQQYQQPPQQQYQQPPMQQPPQQYAQPPQGQPPQQPAPGAYPPPQQYNTGRPF